MKTLLCALLSMILISSARADVAVLTQHNNLSHTGANLEETLLTTNNVNTNTFGLVWTRTVDDQIYAQPLVMTNVAVPGKGIHNLVLVATVNDSVYAFDSDDSSVSTPYWQVSFTNANAVAPRNTDLSALGSCGGNYNDFSGNMGIVSTPTIDPATGTLYVVVRTKEFGSTFVQRLHALNIATGQERAGSPVVITATYSGNGDGNSGGIITFDPARQNQRSGLSLVNGVVYMTWASHCDLGPYHGWVMGFDATNLTRVVVYNDTPNGYNGGVWMSGEGISADTSGNLYLSTGNGSVGYGGDPRNTINRGESILKLTRNGGTLNVASWFTPNNYQALENGDIDLGSSGVLLIPGTFLAFSGGKQGVGYLVNRDNMGGLSFSGADTNIIQSLTLTSDQLHGGMVWWDGPGFSAGYTWPASVNLQQYKFDRTANKFITPVFAQSPTAAPGGQPGGILALSANGSTAGSGILWASHQLTGNANQSVRPGILRAYDAQNVSHELWNSEQLTTRDGVGNFAKFVPPTVANGKVYLATFSGRLDVYGIASGWVAAPTVSPNGGTFSNSVSVSLSDATPGAAIYYTLDGSVPTTGSTLYTSPFTVTNNLLVSAKAFKAGFVDSTVASAAFFKGAGTGLKGSYYSNQSMTFNDPATLTRTDATVNFNWGSGSPDPLITTDKFTVRWTGTVQALSTGNYTFYTTTDDGVRLWINNQLIIDHWVDQGATEWSGTIALVAQQFYNVRMEFYENGGNASATLSWSAATVGKTIIPQSQLYPVTNQPSTVALSGPVNNSTFTASASVTFAASVTALFNPVNQVTFYANALSLGTLTNTSGSLSNTLAMTVTGLAAGTYTLKAVGTDLTGLSVTSAPVAITINNGTGAPYGLGGRLQMTPFLNLPTSSSGTMPALLSQTGVFTNTQSMNTAPAFLPYTVNSPLWSDGAFKTRYFAVPYSGAPVTPDKQIAFATNGEWSFPNGTIFVKTFELATNDTNPNLRRRLETRLIVRSTNGAVYGVTYKWRADNTDADLLSGNLSEDIPITTASGVRKQTWYYPSPSDCLLCHTPSAHYVLGVNARQLNGNLTYASTGQTDNQLRALNRSGLFYPAFDEAAISGFPRLSSPTNLAASLEERARSYLDANCAQCHRPSGTGITFDGRYDTPLTNQNIINALLAKGDLGFDHARVVVPRDVWRSILYGRMNTTNAAVKMPTLARNLIDTNGVQLVGDWINSLAGTPALAPPTFIPNGGSFNQSVGVTVLHGDPAATLRYTLDGSLPLVDSPLYTAPITITSNTTVRTMAFENGYNNSVAANAVFFIDPLQFTSVSLTNGTVHLFFAGTTGQTYILQASTNLVDWVPVNTNIAPQGIFEMTDPQAYLFKSRFYRTLKQ